MLDFFAVLFLLSLAYVLVARFLSRKLQKREESLRLQKELLSLTKEEAEAVAKNNQSKLKEIESRKKEIYSRMMDQVKGQFAYVLAVLIVFYLFLHAVEYLDPYTKDDLVFYPNSSVFNITVVLDKPGVWHAVVYTRGKQVALSFPVYQNSKEKWEYSFAPSLSKDGVEAHMDKTEYFLGENATLSVISQERVDKVVFDRGTQAILYLPFSIFGFRYVEGEKALFVLMAFLSSLVLSIFMKYFPMRIK